MPAIRDYKTKVSLSRSMVKSVKEYLKWQRAPKDGGPDTEKKLLKTNTIYLPLLLLLLGTIQKSALSVLES